MGSSVFAADRSVDRSTEQSSRALFEYANQERIAAGLPALRWDNTLAAAALRHAELMAQNGSISHQYRGEPDLPERVRGEGARFSAVAENVALSGTAESTHSGWMHSPGHRANILDVNMTGLGVGVVRVRGQLYAVEDFSRSVASVSLGEQEREVERMVAAQGLKIEPWEHEARHICEGGHAGSGERRPMFTMRYTTSNLGLLPKQLISAAESGRYRDAAIGACEGDSDGSFSSYHLVVLLF